MTTCSILLQRMDMTLAYVREVTDDDSPVAEKAISWLKEGSEDRNKLKIMAESGNDATKTDKLNVDLIDKGEYSAFKYLYNVGILKLMMTSCQRKIGILPD